MENRIRYNISKSNYDYFKIRHYIILKINKTIKFKK